MIFVAKMDAEGFYRNLGQLLSSRANIGWANAGHTSVDVNLYAYPRRAVSALEGCVDNTDVNKFLATFLRLPKL